MSTPECGKRKRWRCPAGSPNTKTLLKKGQRLKLQRQRKGPITPYMQLKTDRDQYQRERDSLANEVFKAKTKAAEQGMDLERLDGQCTQYQSTIDTKSAEILELKKQMAALEKGHGAKVVAMEGDIRSAAQDGRNSALYHMAAREQRSDNANKISDERELGLAKRERQCERQWELKLQEAGRKDAQRVCSEKALSSREEAFAQEKHDLRHQVSDAVLDAFTAWLALTYCHCFLHLNPIHQNSQLREEKGQLTKRADQVNAASEEAERMVVGSVTAAEHAAHIQAVQAEHEDELKAVKSAANTK